MGARRVPPANEGENVLQDQDLQTINRHSKATAELRSRILVALKSERRAWTTALAAMTGCAASGGISGLWFVAISAGLGLFPLAWIWLGVDGRILAILAEIEERRDIRADRKDRATS